MPQRVRGAASDGERLVASMCCEPLDYGWLGTVPVNGRQFTVYDEHVL
jgi:hypothetical protein